MNKLLPKKRQFRIKKYLWLKNCSLLDLEILLVFPRNPFHASHQVVLGNAGDWKGSQGSQGSWCLGTGSSFSTMPWRYISLKGGKETIGKCWEEKKKGKNELLRPRILESLARCLTDLCTSDFYWIFLSFRLPLIF